MKNMLRHPQISTEKTTKGCISARKVNQRRKSGLSETILSKETYKNISVNLFNH